jgi:putative RNA 2'-phosphotransferase
VTRWGIGPKWVARSALSGILRDGLCAMNRQKVHLSSDLDITIEAARRRSRDVVVIEIDVTRAQAAGVGSYASADPRIVRCDDVPAACLGVKELGGLR